MTDNKKTLTTGFGMPVDNDLNSMTAGAKGPVLVQDVHFLDKLAHFDRERIPERVVHAKGAGAHGYFEVTRDVSEHTRAKFLSKVGNKTEVFVRFSTVGGERGSADSERDPRGFAVKFYTEEGNYDMVGNNTPVFFIRDPLKFPDFIHTQKRNPATNLKDPDMFWDFLSLIPESIHQVTILFSDRGTPASYRKMNGFSSHTYMWYNTKGEYCWVKYHFKTAQGIQNFTREEAERLRGADPDVATRDLHAAIARGEYPAWRLEMQIMTPAQARDYRFDPFDVTKVWPHADFPPVEIGRMILDRNPENYFAEVEQAAFSPGNFVPGIGPSPDKMLQGRLFAYGDAHRYRLGINHTRIPVNAPHAAKADNYGRDGAMRVDDNGARSKNYEPNSFDGPVQTNEPHYGGLPVAGVSGTYQWDKRETNDFEQAGALYRLIDEAAKQRLVGNIADGLAQVSHREIVDRSVSYFRNADPDYGERIARAIAARRA